MLLTTPYLAVGDSLSPQSLMTVAIIIGFVGPLVAVALMAIVAKGLASTISCQSSKMAALSMTFLTYKAHTEGGPDAARSTLVAAKLSGISDTGAKPKPQAPEKPKPEPPKQTGLSFEQGSM